MPHLEQRVAICLSEGPGDPTRVVFAAEAQEYAETPEPRRTDDRAPPAQKPPEAAPEGRKPAKRARN